MLKGNLAQWVACLPKNRELSQGLLLMLSTAACDCIWCVKRPIHPTSSHNQLQEQKRKSAVHRWYPYLTWNPVLRCIRVQCPRLSQIGQPLPLCVTEEKLRGRECISGTGTNSTDANYKIIEGPMPRWQLSAPKGCTATELEWYMDILEPYRFFSYAESDNLKHSPKTDGSRYRGNAPDSTATLISYFL